MQAAPRQFLVRAGLCAGLLAWALPACAAEASAAHRRPVMVVADQRLAVQAAAGQGVLPLYASLPLADTAPQPAIERAVLVLHGRLRDADVYWRSAKKALAAAPAEAARTLLVVPQFLAERDVDAHLLPPETLRWSLEGWEGGEPARGPARISSFEAIDAVLALLADRRRFPHLAQVVVAGHSGGGQVVQRYAVVGQGEARLATAGVKLRYVVANPSSYLYFSADRPLPDGGFGTPASAASCPAYDQWKYGWNGAPDYATQASAAAYEARYVQRDVVYLLGGRDIDPHQSALDRSCSGEAQGPYRLARGRSYAAYLSQRHPGFVPAVHEVPGVGHDGERMLGSACGLSALFDDAAGKAACP